MQTNTHTAHTTHSYTHHTHTHRHTLPAQLNSTQLNLPKMLTLAAYLRVIISKMYTHTHVYVCLYTCVCVSVCLSQRINFCLATPAGVNLQCVCGFDARVAAAK